MTNYEKIKNMSAGEMAELLTNEAFIIWKSEQSIEALRNLNTTQIGAVTQHYYNYFYQLLQEEVEE